MSAANDADALGLFRRLAVDEIEARLNALSELRELPSGSLRITAGRHAVETVLWPVLLRLISRYPDIKVEVSIVGCPAYLADHGIPVEPQDLTHHRCCDAASVSTSTAPSS